MGKTIKLAIFLAIIAGLSGAALSLVNGITEPMIQEAAIASEKQNLVKIYTGGEEFKKVESNIADYPAIKDIYSAGDKGYVYKTSVQGYKGPVVILIGLDKDGIYKGFEVADISQETKGIGDKILDASYQKSIVGKNIGDAIDTISGATYTSKAVVDGIEQASAHFEENFK